MVLSTLGHVAVDGDNLMELDREFCAIRPLYGKAADKWHCVLFDLGLPWHQEVDDDIDIRPTVASGNGPYELKTAQVCSLTIALPLKRIDELCVLAIAQGFGIQAQIHIAGPDMAHVLHRGQQ